jgi:sulfur carrier protein ThiS
VVNFKFKGTLRQVAGCAEAHVPLPATRRLAALLEQLDREFPGVLGSAAEYQWRHGTSDIVVVVNGKIVEEGDIGSTLLDENDEVTLLPPIGGGER